ncbi:hypothetical protein DMENIID0001_057430 [Sergentomyia squamirostris]
MNKFLVFAFLCTALVATNAQFFPVDAGIGFNPWPQVAVDKVLQQISETAVTEEFQAQIDQVVKDLQDGIAACDEALTLTNFFWIYKRCVGFQLKKAQNQALAIQAASQAATTPAQ